MTRSDVLVIIIWIILAIFVLPVEMVVFQHVKALEARTAWICEERTKVIQLPKFEGGVTPVRLLPPGCPKEDK